MIFLSHVTRTYVRITTKNIPEKMLVIFSETCYANSELKEALQNGTLKTKKGSTL